MGRVVKTHAIHSQWNYGARPNVRTYCGKVGVLTRNSAGEYDEMYRNAIFEIHASGTMPTCKRCYQGITNRQANEPKGDGHE